MCVKCAKTNDIINDIEKLAMMVDVFGFERGKEILTQESIKAKVNKRAKLFTKKVKREGDIASILRTIAEALTKETSSFFRSCSIGLGGGVTPFFLSKATKPDLFKFQKPFIPFLKIFNQTWWI